MSTPLIVLVTLIYTGVSISEALNKHGGMSLMFASYAFANVGLIWSMMK